MDGEEIKWQGRDGGVVTVSSGKLLASYRHGTPACPPQNLVPWKPKARDRESHLI